MSPEQIVFSVVGLLLTMFAQTIGIIKYLDGKSDSRINDLKDQMIDEVTHVKRELAEKRAQDVKEREHIHNRVNDVKDCYVKISIYDKDIHLIRSTITEIRSEFREDHQKLVELTNKGIRDTHKDVAALLTDVMTKIGKQQ